MSDRKNQIPYVLVPTLTEEQKKKYKYSPSAIHSNPKNRHESIEDTINDDNSQTQIKDVIGEYVLHEFDNSATDIEGNKMIIKAKDSEINTTDYNKVASKSTIYKATSNVDNINEFFENESKDSMMSQGVKLQLQEQEYLTDGEIEEIVLLSSGEDQKEHTLATISKGIMAVDRGIDESNLHESDMDEIMEIKYRNSAVQYLIKYKSLREQKWIIANEIDPKVNKELLEKKDKRQKDSKNSKDRKRKRHYEIEDNDRDWKNEVVEDGKLTKHYNEVVNTKCPQKVIEYYEKHLVFSPKKSKK
ncbi:8358_t:CDS:2 [Funneliformis geosporum]|uniref:3971_t:CDS:1 n=1 Tax=Funneliformis geosporum TaxID=1117311 RepID=A0A9W4ST58_9GLOM|nr:3971_t:CDS:2 [Funneliformis geosporum]CAI2183937.1 8358_t:CDS:2 [Funneliformis geosporum]